MASFDGNSASAQMDQYSRQIGAYGIETMKNLAALSVLIVGASGTGFEAAKDLILAGPKAVAIYDKTPVAIADLGTNAFLAKEDVGKPRAACCVGKLAVLNPYVHVSECAEPPTAESLKAFGAVLVTDSFLPLETLVAWDSACRENGSVFLLAFCNGVVCSIFSDFGPKHVSTDLTGEPDHILPIDCFEIKEEPFGIRVHINGSNHGLEDGALVTIGGAKGVEIFEKVGSMSAKRCYTVYDGGKRRRLEAKYFDLVLTQEQEHTLKEHAKEIVDSGFVTEVRQKKEFHFASLKDSLLHPATPEAGMIPCPSMEKMFSNRGEQLHFARLGVWEFAKANGGAFPRLHSMEDAAAVLKFAQAKLDEFRKTEGAVTVQALDENVVKNFALYYRAELLGLCTFAGGVVAQEVVKKFGKFTPLERWMQVDFLEMLPEQAEVRPDAAPQGTRYDHVVSLFGAGLQDRLSRMNWFMVGCGALGCEYLKAFSLLGIATAPEASVSVTDMDRIEVSNLSRQFLFRRENVGQQKAVCAANAARAFNPDFHVTCYETKVCPETENVFNDAFWGKLDGVCNALDNIPARKYVDSRCVFYEKPLLESGTEGTKANSELIIPFQTSSFSENDQEAPEGNGIPMCTLRNFPHLIDHCIEWARAHFTDSFEVPMKDAADLVKGDESALAAFIAKVEKEGNPSVRAQKVESLLAFVEPVAAGAGKPTMRTCMQLALRNMYESHAQNIDKLVWTFPEDSMSEDPDTGEKRPFWSGTKRFPQTLTFDERRVEEYLFPAANLYAATLGVAQVHDRAEFQKEFASEKDALKKLFDGWKKEDAEKRAAAASSESGSTEDSASQFKPFVDRLKAAVAAVKAKGVSIQSLEFEKDDDTNFHIDYITECSNTRAWNYHIPEATRFQCKMIAGKIIPALATTTALITGLVSVELLKLAMGFKSTQMEGANVNLAINSYTFFEPPAPIKAVPTFDNIEMCDVKPIPAGFTCWDKVVVDTRGLTVSQVIESFPKIHHGVECTMLLKASLTASESDSANSFLYTSFAPTRAIREAVAKYKDMLFKDAYADLYKEDVSKMTYVIMDGSYEYEGEPVKIPLVKFLF